MNTAGDATARGPRALTANRRRLVASAILAHALFAYLGAKWIDINIVVVLVAICAWPFWWVLLGLREMRTRLILLSLALGTLVYAPSLGVIKLMLSMAGH